MSDPLQGRLTLCLPLQGVGTWSQVVRGPPHHQGRVLVFLGDLRGPGAVGKTCDVQVIKMVNEMLESQAPFNDAIM